MSMSRNPNKNGLKPMPISIASDLKRYPAEAVNLCRGPEHTYTPGPRVIETEESDRGEDREIVGPATASYH